MKKIIKVSETELIDVIKKVVNESYLTTEARGHTQQGIRIEAITLLKSLGIKTDESTIEDVVDILKQIITNYGDGRILN
jgi:hypothetical protein